MEGAIILPESVAMKKAPLPCWKERFRNFVIFINNSWSSPDRWPERPHCQASSSGKPCPTK